MDLSNTAFASERLRLSAFAPHDAADVWAAVTPSLTRFMAFAPSPSAGAFAEVWRGWLPRMAAGRDLFLVVRLAATQAFLGMSGLHGIGGAAPETGVWIKEDAHGHGYGREAVAAVVAWAARACGASAVLYPVVAANHPSRRLAERLGGAIVGARRLRKPGSIEHGEVVYRIAAPRAA